MMTPKEAATHTGEIKKGFYREGIKLSLLFIKIF